MLILKQKSVSVLGHKQNMLRPLDSQTWLQNHVFNPETFIKPLIYLQMF